MREIADRIVGDSLGTLLKEITDPEVGKTVGNITAKILQGATQVDPNDRQKLKLAQQKAQKLDTSNNAAADPKTVAGTVAAAVTKGKGPVAGLNTTVQAKQGMNNTSADAIEEEGEGKMGYPTNYKPKRDRDPRHPANKRVSANPGFVGG